MAPVSQVERPCRVNGGVALLRCVGCCDGNNCLNTYYMWDVVVGLVVTLSVWGLTVVLSAQAVKNTFTNTCSSYKTACTCINDIAPFTLSNFSHI